MSPFFLVAAWLLNVLGSWLSALLGWTDWSLIGWAFAASTAFVVYEATQKEPIKRTGWQRAGMIAVGMVISLGCNGWVSTAFNWPIVPVTLGLGAGGYRLLGKYLTKVEKAESIDDVTNTKL